MKRSHSSRRPSARRSTALLVLALGLATQGCSQLGGASSTAGGAAPSVPSILTALTGGGAPSASPASSIPLPLPKPAALTNPLGAITGGAVTGAPGGSTGGAPLIDFGAPAAINGTFGPMP